MQPVVQSGGGVAECTHYQSSRSGARRAESPPTVLPRRQCRRRRGARAQYARSVACPLVACFEHTAVQYSVVGVPARYFIVVQKHRAPPSLASKPRSDGSIHGGGCGQGQISRQTSRADLHHCAGPMRPKAKHMAKQCHRSAFAPVASATPCAHHPRRSHVSVARSRTPTCLPTSACPSSHLSLDPR